MTIERKIQKKTLNKGCLISQRLENTIAHFQFICGLNGNVITSQLFLNSNLYFLLENLNSNTTMFAKTFDVFSSYFV